MAVTLNHTNHDTSRQRASVILSSMDPYYQSNVVHMPTPEEYQNAYPTPISELGGCCTFSPSHYPQPIHQESVPYLQSSGYSYYTTLTNSPVHYDHHAPPLPPKTPLQQPPSPQHSEHSSGSVYSTQSTARTSIEPDPLPPHSNPQALSQSQSEAFSESQPIPPLHIGKDEIWNATSGLVEFTISREGAHLPSFMSSKPLLIITMTASFTPMGNVRFHTISSNKIDLTINGQQTSISHTGVLHLCNRWGFRSTTCPNTVETWYWKKDKMTGGAMLEDAKKHGRCLARMNGDLISFEKPRLSQESYDEILVSAIAMAEAARRQKRKNDIVDIASAIGDFTSSDGGAGGAGGAGGSTGDDRRGSGGSGLVPQMSIL